jgi:hypothetical protein
MTLVTLPDVTDAATMRKISFWRYLAVNRKTLFAALASALLTFSMLGCGTTNHLQSIQLTANVVNGVSQTGQSGFYNLVGNGGTIQLKATGTYSDKKTKDLTGVVTYNVIVDPVNGIDAFDVPLLPPCQAPCQDPTKGTVEFSSTGLITAIEPATCSWKDLSSDPTKPAWFYSGAYQVTVSFQGVSSQPVFLPIASSAGNIDNPDYGLTGNNPTYQCGPAS